MIALGFVAQVVPLTVLLTLMLVIFSALFLIGSPRCSARSS